MQWLVEGTTTDWVFAWYFPITFSSLNYVVICTHLDFNFNTTIVTHFNKVSKSYAHVGGNQINGLSLNALAVGY